MKIRFKLKIEDICYYFLNLKKLKNNMLLPNNKQKNLLITTIKCFSFSKKLFSKEKITILMNNWRKLWDCFWINFKLNNNLDLHHLLPHLLYIVLDKIQDLELNLPLPLHLLHQVNINKDKIHIPKHCFLKFVY